MPRENDARRDMRNAPHPAIFGGYVALVTLSGLGVLAFMLAQHRPGAAGPDRP